MKRNEKIVRSVINEMYSGEFSEILKHSSEYWYGEPTEVTYLTDNAVYVVGKQSYEDGLLMYNKANKLIASDEMAGMALLDDVESDLITHATKDGWYNVDEIRKIDFNMSKKMDKQYL